MLRKKKLYSRPRKLYQTQRIKEENVLVRKYALKNKREVWKTLAKVNYYRKRAQALANSPLEEQEILFGKLNDLGLKISSIADVLGLKVEDLLNRRLPTVVALRGLASTPKQARQLVAHKKVLIDGKVVNSPSYLVRVHEESAITIKLKQKIQKAGETEKTGQQEVVKGESG